VLEDNLKAIIKPQYVDNIPKAVKGIVGDLIRKKNEREVLDDISVELGTPSLPPPSSSLSSLCADMSRWSRLIYK
jgi:hypothetical protein